MDDSSCRTLVPDSADRGAHYVFDHARPEHGGRATFSVAAFAGGGLGRSWGNPVAHVPQGDAATHLSSHAFGSHPGIHAFVRRSCGFALSQGPRQYVAPAD